MLVNMKEMLDAAKEGKYGVGFFNAVNVEMARAVIETAEELRAPIIVGTAEILLPAMKLERVAEYLIPMAQKASVPVCVHYDHGLTFERCMQALRLGFTSIMYDCSTASYEKNTENVAEMVKICHAMGVTVEGELGHVGDNAGDGKLENPEDYFTDPIRQLILYLERGLTHWQLQLEMPTAIMRFLPNWILNGLKRSLKKQDCRWYCMAAAGWRRMISGRLSDWEFLK